MIYKKKTIRDLDFTGRRVLVRVDFNVPLHEGKVLSDARIRASLPTLTYLAEAGAAVVICSHLGRPKGKKDPSLSLRPVYERLRGLSNRPTHFVPDCIGKEVQEAAKALQAGEFLLIENTRFYAGETENDAEFAAQLASLGEILVNDAFGTAHRSHASNVGVAHILPAVAGLLIEKELSYLGDALEAPEHPFVAILGGSKISDKIGVVSRLLQRADTLLVGGGMANAFLEAEGYSMGASRSEQEVIRQAVALLDRGGEQIKLPIDLEVADAFAEDARHRTVNVDNVPEGWLALDIGPKTVAEYTSHLDDARTVVWNGPMGVYEFEAFAEGTLSIARAVAACEGTTIVGGGSSADAVDLAGVHDRIDHVSTGGGASLRMLEGKELPGISVLLEKDDPIPGWA
jgi:phosphoglycerate kinase